MGVCTAGTIGRVSCQSLKISRDSHFWLCVGALSLVGCRAAPDEMSLAPGAVCPPGMVLVEGQGLLGANPGDWAVVETAGRAEVIAPETECAAALAAHPRPIGCWVQTDLVDPVLRPRSVSLAPFCVDAYPFPGQGHRYTTDGMTTWDARVFQNVLSRGNYGGRRFCTATELQAAVAGLPANQAVIYGDQHDPRRCPLEQPIGTDGSCRNERTGVHEYTAVVSHWVVADEDFVAHACDGPPCRAAGNRPLTPGMLVVLGGTGRVQTRQAPLTPHTWHDHGKAVPLGCDDMGHDDQPAICATPSPGWGANDPSLWAGERAYQALVSVARASGRVDRMLADAVGGEVCSEAALTAP